MAKNYILENGFEMDIPKQLIKFLKRRNVDWEWYDMREIFLIHFYYFTLN